MEIFDHWWEYFRLIIWSFSPPKFIRINNDVPPTLEQIRKGLDPQILKLARDVKAINMFREKLNRLEDTENGIKLTIEGKAHSMVSQSGLAVTLLLTAISLFSLKSDGWGLVQLIWIYSFLSIITLNLVTAALLARNVIALNYTLTKQVISDISSKYIFHDSIIEQLFIIKQTSYFNSIKASFLKYAHWYFKATLICVLVLVFSLPLFSFLPKLSVVNSDIKKNHTHIMIDSTESKIRCIKASSEFIDVKVDSMLKNQDKVNGKKK